MNLTLTGVITILLQEEAKIEEKVEEKKEEKAKEKKEEAKPEEKKEEELLKPPPPFVLHVDLHCVGCAKKIARSIMRIRGNSAKKQS